MIKNIQNIQDLAEEVLGMDPDNALQNRAFFDALPKKHLLTLLKKTVFKSTECGCTFNSTQTGVSVSGYCEGSDGELPVHTLTYPFEASAFWKALDEADDEGENEWNCTHGCPECYPPEYIRGECPVNPHCRRCDGDGEII